MSAMKYRQVRDLIDQKVIALLETLKVDMG